MWFLTRSIARSMCTGVVNGHAETRSSWGRTQQLQLRAALRPRHRLHRELQQQPLMFQLEPQMWDLFAPARRRPEAAHLAPPASPSAAACSSSSTALLQTCPWRAASPAHIQALVLDPEEDPRLLPLLSSASSQVLLPVPLLLRQLQPSPVKTTAGTLRFLTPAFCDHSSCPLCFFN